MTEYIQGAIAVILVGSMVAISIIETVQGKPFSEPLTLAGLTLLAVGFYFGQAGKTANRIAATQGAATALAGVTAAAQVVAPALGSPIPSARPDGAL